MSKKSFEKKKERERKSKKKVLLRREESRNKLRTVREEDKKARDAEKIANRVSGRTIIGRTCAEDQIIVDQLQHNMKVLEAIMDEYDSQKKISEENSPPVVQKKPKASAEVVFKPNS